MSILIKLYPRQHKILKESQDLTIDHKTAPMKAEGLLRLIRLVRREHVMGIRVSDTVRAEVKDFLYKVIAGLFPTVNSRKFSFDENFAELRRVWEDFFGHEEYWGYDTHWASRRYNWKQPARGSRTGAFYISLEKSAKNIMTFMHSVHLLEKRLRQLSERAETPIAFKTHKNFHIFVQHNDSLKIYFANESLRSEIVGAVREWVSQNDIAISPRTHEDGYDQNDDEVASFGQILAKESADYVIDYVLSSMSNSTEEQQLAEISKNFPDVVRRNAKRLQRHL